jgi:predicted metal-dependent hydrolase
MTACLYKDIEYNLTQSDRKTLSIYVENNGSITVIAPNGLDKNEIEKVIEKKRYSIYKNLAEWRMLNESFVDRQFVNGEGFLYLGSSYRLQIEEALNVPLKLYQGYFLLHKKELKKATTHFKDFYKEKALIKIPGRIKLYQNRIGVFAADIRVMDLKTHWASCSESGTLNFHWKCMMAPLKVIDYIVVHELAHLIHKTHSDAFWNLVDKVIPDYHERKEWLRNNGAMMDL